MELEPADAEVVAPVDEEPAEDGAGDAAAAGAAEPSPNPRTVEPPPNPWTADELAGGVVPGLAVVVAEEVEGAGDEVVDEEDDDAGDGGVRT